MPVLTPGQAFVTDQPQLLVENKLAPGVYRFQLVVLDEAQNASAVAELQVTIRPAPPQPTPPQPTPGPQPAPRPTPIPRPTPPIGPIPPRPPIRPL